MINNFEKNLNILILKTNEPILVKNVNIESFSNKIVIPSNISQDKLSIIGTHPLWLIELELLSKKKEISILIIDKIDEIPLNEQMKFFEIIKYRSISGFKLPENTHIILTCNSFEKVADKIKSNCLLEEVE